MQAYDHNPEQKAITESGLDSSNRAGDKMMQEVLSTDIKDWRALFQRGDAGKSNVFDRQWQADSGGRLVQLDMISGKLLTHNDRGDKVDYESQSDNVVPSVNSAKTGMNLPCPASSRGAKLTASA